MRKVVERLTPFQHFCNYFAQSAIFRETFTFAANVIISPYSILDRMIFVSDLCCMD